MIVVFAGVMAIGVGAYVVSQPRKGTLEWHRRGYINARRGFLGYSRVERIRRLCVRITGGTPERFWQERRQRLAQQWTTHEKALLKMGYLVEREVQANETGSIIEGLRSEEAVEDCVAMVFEDVPGNWNPYRVRITGPAAVLPKWEEMIRKGEMPQRRRAATQGGQK